MKKSSWSFLYEATKQEKEMVVKTLRQCDNDINLPINASSSKIVEEIKNEVGLPKHASYQDFIIKIGTFFDCTELSWEKYEYVLLSKILIEKIKRADKNSFNEEIAKALNLSNTGTKALCSEIEARTKNSEEFRIRLPFFLTSLQGVQWENAITALPKLGSISTITSMLSTIGVLTAFAPTFIKVLTFPLTIGAGIFGVFAGIGKSLFYVSYEKLLPLVSVLILIKQEHDVKFNTQQEAITYVKNEIQLQKVFPNRSYAALSLVFQIADCEKNSQIREYKQIFDTALLHNKRLPIPEYRLKIILPYKEGVYTELMKWVENDYRRTRLNFSITDNIYSAFKYSLLGNSSISDSEQEINVTKQASKTRNTETDSDIVFRKENLDHNKEVVEQIQLTDKDEKISRLEARVAELQARLEENEKTFQYLRHDIALTYGSSLRPLYIYIQTHRITDEEVSKAISKAESVTQILSSVGKTDFGVADIESKTLSTLVEDKMNCESFCFRWNDQADKKIKVRISSITFVNRVLGNLVKNFEVHAFPTKFSVLFPNKEKIVEANITDTDECILLTISNNGLPISEQNIGQIFKFGACFGDNAGDGRGLSYIKEYMEHWNGSVDACIPQDEFSIMFTFKFFKQ